MATPGGDEGFDARALEIAESAELFKGWLKILGITPFRTVVIVAELADDVLNVQEVH